MSRALGRRNLDHLLLRLLPDRGGGFSFALAEIVQLCAAHFALALDFDFGNARRVYRKNAFDTFAVTDAANGEVRIRAGTLTANDNSAVNLNALLVAFDDSGMDLHSIADAKLRNVLLELFALDFFDNAHGHKKLGLFS